MDKNICHELGNFGFRLGAVCDALLVARRAAYVVDGRFFGHFFWKVEGTVCIHVSHVQLPYMVINMYGNIQGGGGTKPNIGKLGNSENLHIAIKVAGSIGSHIGSSIWQPP